MHRFRANIFGTSLKETFILRRIGKEQHLEMSDGHLPLGDHNQLIVSRHSHTSLARIIRLQSTGGSPVAEVLLNLIINDSTIDKSWSNSRRYGGIKFPPENFSKLTISEYHSSFLPESWRSKVASVASVESSCKTYHFDCNVDAFNLISLCGKFPSNSPSLQIFVFNCPKKTNRPKTKTNDSF